MEGAAARLLAQATSKHFLVGKPLHLIRGCAAALPTKLLVACCVGVDRSSSFSERSNATPPSEDAEPPGAGASESAEKQIASLALTGRTSSSGLGSLRDSSHA